MPAHQPRGSQNRDRDHGFHAAQGETGGDSWGRTAFRLIRGTQPLPPALLALVLWMLSLPQSTSSARSGTLVRWADTAL